MLGRDAARLLAFENARHHVAGLHAQVVKIRAVSRDGAALHCAGVGGHQGQLDFRARFVNGFIGRHHTVVKRSVEQIHFAFEAAHGSAHIGGARRGHGHHFDVFRRQKSFHAFKRGGGIDFAGAVNIADALQIGHQFLHQFKLRLKRDIVRHAGNIGA